MTKTDPFDQGRLIYNINLLYQYLFQPHSLGGDRHVHWIISVSSSDEGSYSCIAENVIGQAQQVAYLAVSGQGGGGGGVAWVVAVMWLLWLLIDRRMVIWGVRWL